MKKLHIAISTDKIEETISDYTKRFGTEPCCVVPGEYALWRVDGVNLSIRQDATCKPGELRHLGFEDSTATEFSEEKDVNGITWERFTAELQAEEINSIWPETGYKPA